MKRIPFNMNHYVWVRLTDRGRELLRHREKIIWPNGRPVAVPPRMPPRTTDERGFERWQLWELMQELGYGWIQGMDVPFETEIEIEVRP
ncbi:hypothetical protein ACMT4L_16990 [Deinococcus sp. A31D244]|uniref:hypothetical protein n=1 Tax=Deinococcus sp. A31D244 TaxID=3397675 RepID=UPI0039DF7605